jgi:hypothetical protein
MRKGANIWFRIVTKLKKIGQRPISNPYKIPIIINNFNRLDFLKQQIDWLQKAGYTNIHIIDNQSTYPPLLEYYKTLPYTIYRLDRNQGHFSIWETILFSRFSHDYYVYTDPDILPVEGCPSNILAYFQSLLHKYPGYKKVGFGLLINDLPDSYNLKPKVVKWEQQFWEKPLEQDVYDALIDTTFALYRPGAKGGADGPAIRTAGKYVARHLPWYENSAALDEETQYYLRSSSAASSWYAAAKGENEQYNTFSEN